MLDDLATLIRDRALDQPRLIVAIAGAPGAGKSTLAGDLAARLGALAVVMPMDGYHLDNAVLEARGLRARKGAPETFDVAGMVRDLERLRADEPEVLVPVFDRGLDLSRAAARVIGPQARIVLVEGNYLLLDRAPWEGLASFWDLTVMVSTPEPVLRARLVQRWLVQDHDLGAAEARAEGNDLRNARIVAAESRTADVAMSGL